MFKFSLSITTSPWPGVGIFLPPPPPLLLLLLVDGLLGGVGVLPHTPLLVIFNPDTCVTVPSWAQTIILSPGKSAGNCTSCPTWFLYVEVIVWPVPHRPDAS